MLSTFTKTAQGTLLTIQVVLTEISSRRSNALLRQLAMKTIMQTEATMELGFGNNCFVGHVVHIFLAFLFDPALFPSPYRPPT